MVKKLYFSIICSCILLLVQSCNSGNEINIFPEPSSVNLKQGSFNLEKGLRIETKTPEENAFLVSYLKEKLRKHFNHSDQVNSSVSGDGNVIRMILDPENFEEDSYSLKVNRNEIILRGRKSGLLYGINTLSQLIDPEKNSIPCLEIEDQPEFQWRGMHLDVSRHFFSPDFIKKYIDILAMHKMNVFHWHLTDDQGWRIEIKKYPGLTEKGAWRKNRTDQPWSYELEFTTKDDPEAYGGYYSRDELREIVEYAEERNVTIIPEIEMPGHSQAALYALPQLSCSGEIYRKPDDVPFQFTDPFCAGNDSTFIFLKDVLDEVISVFPSEYIHIGGDEARKDPWMHCEKCRQRMKDENLSDLEELQAWFIEQVYDYLHSRGRKLIGWNEIMEGDLRKDAAIMAWKGEGIASEAIREGYPTVSAESEYYYLSRTQDAQSDMMGRLLSLEKVYEHNPFGDVPELQKVDKAMGIQGCIWTENIFTGEEVQEHLLPRMAAIAERAWSGFKTNDFQVYSENLIPYFEYLDREGIAYYVSGPTGLFNDKFAGESYNINLDTRIPGSKIYYSLDGSIPSTESYEYSSPIEILDSRVVKASVFLPSGKSSPVFTANYEKVDLSEPKEISGVIPGLELKYSFKEMKSLKELDSISHWKDTVISTVTIPDWLQGTDNFSMTLEGWLKIDEDGVYRFFSASDDGSRVFINENLVCDNDGIHGSNYFIKGFAGLKKGYHEIKIEFFEAKYGEDLVLEMEGPGFSRKPLPAEILFRLTKN